MLIISYLYNIQDVLKTTIQNTVNQWFMYIQIYNLLNLLIVSGLYCGDQTKILEPVNQ